MSGSIDERVVQMKFDNKQFETGVASTLRSLAELDKGLNNGGAAKGLDAMGRGIENISSKFSAMSAVAITALATIVHQATLAGASLAKNLTIGPIGDGFSDYNEKLTSVQTIMNATGASLEKVSGYFTELDHYADKTIYNLKDMTGAFAKFTNAGVKMETSIPAIKGIANMVALAGQGAGAAGIAFYNLSQSIAGGFLTTVDYKSLNLANVATKEWKDQMIAGAVAAGTLKKEAGGTYSVVGSGSDKAYKSAALFNEALSEGWASTEVLLKVLGDYGDVTTDIGRKALAAAQDVKSLPMMFETLKAAVGTGWTDTFEIVLGTLPEAKKLFTDLTVTIGGFLDGMADARNKVLGDWKALGGRTVLIDGIKAAFEGLMSVIRPIKEAFRDIFPAMTGQRLFEITLHLRNLADRMKLGSETAEDLKRTFKGVFAIFSIIGQVIGAVIGMFFDLFGTVGEGTGGFLEFTGSIGDVIVAIDDALKHGTFLTDFFGGLGKVLAGAIKIIQNVGGFIADLFGEFDQGAAKDTIDACSDLGRVLAPLGAIGERLGGIFTGVAKVFARLGEALRPLVQFVQDAFMDLGSALSDVFGGGNFNNALDALNTGLFAGLILILRKFSKDGLSITAGFGNGLTGLFGQLTNNLKAMQQNVKADTLLKIAIALGLLTLSVVALSMIDSEKLSKALTAMAVGFAQLLGAMAILVKISGAAGFIKVPMIAAAMVLLATSILILSAAVKVLSTMSWEELAKGLGGVAALLLSLSVAAQLMGKASGPMLRAGLAMIPLAFAINLLAVAMKIMATMSWEELAKGLVGLAGALTLIAIAMQLMPLTLPITAAGLVLVGAALVVIGTAMKIMASMSWEEIGKGMVGIAGALVLIAGAMHLMPLTLPLTAAGLVLVAVALTNIAAVAKIFATMSWQDMAKAAVAMAGALAIIAGGLYLMSGTLLGSAALLVASAALAVLAPVLVVLGSMSWEMIGKGLTMLAGALAVLGLAGLLLTPVIPALMGLGVAIALVGVGTLAAGLGILALSAGLTALSIAGVAGAVAITAIGAAIIGLLPMALKALAEGIVLFAIVIGNAGPVFTKAMVKLIMSLLAAILVTAPKVIAVMMSLLQQLLTAIQKNLPQFVSKGMDIITGFLSGIAKKLPGLISAATDVVVAFIKGVSKSQSKIIQAGVELIIDFVNGLAKAIDRNSAAMGAAGGRLGVAIVKGMAKGIAGGLSIVTSAAKALASSALSAAKGILGINSPSKEFEYVGEWSGEGMAKGLTNMEGAVGKSAEDLGREAMASLTKSVTGLAELMSADMDVTPVITPVLDLSDVQKDASKIGALLNTKPFSVEGAYSVAKDAADAYHENHDPRDDDGDGESGGDVIFNQYNNSPKALSAGEIYRQTNNQLSVAKGALKP